MIGFEDQNKLFCSSDDSDVAKKFITLLNRLIVNVLRCKVTISRKTMEIKIANLTLMKLAKYELFKFLSFYAIRLVKPFATAPFVCVVGVAKVWIASKVWVAGPYPFYYGLVVFFA